MTTPVVVPFGVRYELLKQLPTDLRTGDALILELLLHNIGYTPWLTSGPYPVRLGYRWLNQQGVAVVADGGRALLPAPVPPGMRTRVEIRVEAPPAAGSYTLQVELLEEGQAWFSQRGVAPLQLTVAFTPVKALRVAILNGNVVAHDAVGSHIVAQLTTLRSAGYQTLLLTGFVDSRLPVDVRRSMAMVSPEQLRDPTNKSAAAEHWRRADLVIVNYSSYYDLVELIREVQRGVVVFDYHGVTPPALWGREWPGYADLVRGRDNLSLVGYADYAIGHSRFTCDELIATKLIASSRVALMPYAVVQASGYAEAPAPEVVERFTLTGSHVLLYVGRMARNKCVHHLVEAMPTILAHHPRTQLLLVGDTQFTAYREYAGELAARAAELGLSDHVQITGQVDNRTLEELYRACTIFVTASMHEGFCMPLVEAMSRGRPVVATESTAIPHTLGGSGLLFAPGDVAGLATQVCRLLAELPDPGDHQDPLHAHRLAPVTAADLQALRERPIAMITPRYGPDVLGGAETGIRNWAEQLAARGYQVEVLSTCTVDMADWRDHLAPGVEMINGVRVRRFRTSPVDVHRFHQLLQKANRGERLHYHEEQEFMANNLRSHDLEAYLAAHSHTYACLICSPYLFGTSYWPVHYAPERTILLPCLHDEPSARLGLFRTMLERAAALLFNSEAEGRLASQTLGVANPYRTRIGYGFADEPIVGDAERFRARYGLTDPILLYSGRLEHAKHVPLLLEWFATYKVQNPAPLTLVLAGSGDVPLPQRPDIVALGMIRDPQTLADAYAAALALCQLSLNESFSIVMMESWLQRRPVLVHADCAVTRDHVEWSGGGYALSDYTDFEAAVTALRTDSSHGDTLGQRGYAYVCANYSWRHLIERMEQSLAAFSRPRSLYAQLSQQGVVRALDFTHQRFADELLHYTEGILATALPGIRATQQAMLQRAAQVARPGYTVQSAIPLLGPVVGWLRRQLTSHLKEPYLDPMMNDQDHFNHQLLTTLLPALDASLREQRRLRAELDLLRDQFGTPQRDGS